MSHYRRQREIDARYWANQKQLGLDIREQAIAKAQRERREEIALRVILAEMPARGVGVGYSPGSDDTLISNALEFADKFIAASDGREE